MNYAKIFYIPGWASGRAGQAPLLDELRRFYQVEVLWLPDVAGAHDESPPEARPDFARAILLKLENEPAPSALIGWSTGGMVAMELAAARPELFHSLVLISTTARFCADASRPIGALAEDLNNLLNMLPHSSEKALRRFFGLCCSPGRADRDSISRMVQQAMDADSGQLAQGLRYLQATDLLPILSGIACRSLILHGDRDAVVPVEAGYELLERLPRSQMAIAEGAGHLLPDQRPEFILQHVTEFIALR